MRVANRDVHILHTLVILCQYRVDYYSLLLLSMLFGYLPFRMRLISDVRVERWSMSNQHRSAYGRWKTHAFAHARRKYSVQLQEYYVRHGSNEIEKKLMKRNETRTVLRTRAAVKQNCIHVRIRLAPPTGRIIINHLPYIIYYLSFIVIIIIVIVR